jgi:hypothetical protein
MPLLLLSAAGCAKCTPSEIEPASARLAIRQTCEPIYGRASDWDNISDDLARNIYRHNRMCDNL